MAKDDTYYVEEFLFRGRRVGDNRPTDWHLIIGLNGTDPAGRPYPPLPIMSSAQAIAKGWDISKIFAEINQDLLANLEAERERSRELASSVDTLSADLDAERRGHAAACEALEAEQAARLELEAASEALEAERAVRLELEAATEKL